MTSISCKFIFLTNSKAANSAVLLSVGSIIVIITIPSAHHSISGLILVPFLYSYDSFSLFSTLSKSSSSSIYIILSGFSNVHPSINIDGLSIAFSSYWATLLYPKWAVTGAK